MKHFYNTLFINNRFFYILGGIALLFIVGFFIPIFFMISKVLLFSLVVFSIIDVFLLFNVDEAISADRLLPEKLSNGDNNKITLDITNLYAFKIYLNVIEELPFQFQKRNFKINIVISSKETKTKHYNLKPKERGVYNFGNTNIYASSFLQLATRKYVLSEEKELKCYPSFLNLGDFDFKKLSIQTSEYGSKKNRKIGHSLEFEQIKEYVAGDDIRTINWKATAKRNQLMVNQYVEEKSQTVYMLIDKGRAMQLQFNGITLLDYAINATMALSNVILKKQDKAGTLSFSTKLEDWVVAERRSSQMRLISEALYNVKTNFYESDFSSLYAIVKRKITTRSLLILYTNFETMDALNRQLQYLRALAKNHLVLVVFFKNTELETLINKKSDDIENIYDSIIAEKFMYEKKQIVNELKKYGIPSILTKPENLTGNTINKYLDLKAKGFF